LRIHQKISKVSFFPQDKKRKESRAQEDKKREWENLGGLSEALKLGVKLKKKRGARFGGRSFRRRGGGKEGRTVRGAAAS